MVTFSELLQKLYGKKIKVVLIGGGEFEGMIDFLGADVIALHGDATHAGSGIIPFSAIARVVADQNDVRNILAQRPFVAKN